MVAPPPTTASPWAASLSLDLAQMRDGGKKRGVAEEVGRVPRQGLQVLELAVAGEPPAMAAASRARRMAQLCGVAALGEMKWNLGFQEAGREGVLTPREARLAVHRDGRPVAAGGRQGQIRPVREEAVGRLAGPAVGCWA